MVGTLFFVPTPIGNLEDITLRALRVLREVDLIACEDTRHTRKLLTHFDISTPTTSYHEHNEYQRIDFLIKFLNEGKSIAVVSDAGTPGISDPGALLAKAAIEMKIQVTVLPGPCAVVPALVASGLNVSQFYFVGFAPPKKNARQEVLRLLCEIEHTLVFYEAPHRILQFLEDAKEIFGDRVAVVAREISKKYEEFLRAPISELLAHFKSHSPRGEMVVLFTGKVFEKETNLFENYDLICEEVEKLVLQKGISSNEALKILSKLSGISKRDLYKEWQQRKDLKIQ